MYKIAVLGCENSHASAFISYCVEEKAVDDVEFVGVYSDDPEASKRLNEQFGVPVMENYDDLVGKVDGIIITARHGANHYKYAKPYIKTGVPMFIDKPITCSEEEALEMARELKKYNVRVSGGSSVPLTTHIQKLKADIQQNNYGKVLGGHLRAPINMNNPYGDFYFYSQHLVESMCEIFGYFPKSVQAFVKNEVITCVVRYDDFDVIGEYTDGINVYSAHISCADDFVGGSFPIMGCYELEFMEYYSLLKGGEQHQSLEQFIAPVNILCAIERSLKSGKEEKINPVGEI